MSDAHQTGVFGERLLAALRTAGISQTELADRIGVTRGAVTHWVRGVSEPTRANMRVVTKVLGVSEDWLRGKSNQGVASGIMADGELIKPDDLAGDIAKSILAAAAGRSAEIWRLSSDRLASLGYRPGDFVVVDLRKPPMPRDVVLAEVKGTPVFRFYAPPYLHTLSPQPEPPLVENRDAVILRGVVVSRFSFT